MSLHIPTCRHSECQLKWNPLQSRTQTHIFTSSWNISGYCFVFSATIFAIALPLNDKPRVSEQPSKNAQTHVTRRYNHQFPLPTIATLCFLFAVILFAPESLVPRLVLPLISPTKGDADRVLKINCSLAVAVLDVCLLNIVVALELIRAAVAIAGIGIV